MNDLRVIALTHREFPLETIGQFHLAPEQRADVLRSLKERFNMGEVMYLSTCNRVEIIFTLEHYVCPGLTAQILSHLRPDISEENVRHIATHASRHNGEESVEHLLRVASSLESVVIGEREIITQLRLAYEASEEAGLTGDDLRLVIKQCIKTAKEVFTHTDLARKPVSVVSLAWQEFRNRGYNTDARILLVGSGQIIRNFCKFLHENGYTAITIANRTLSRAETLAATFGGNAIGLSELASTSMDVDVIVSCTASEDAVIDASIYRNVTQGPARKRLVIDLAVPADIAPEVTSLTGVDYVDMTVIQKIASANISFREQALEDCAGIIEAGMNEFERMYQERRIERAMRSIPETIREIRNTALGSVFAKDLENLDDNSKEVLEKIILYMEKKYISVPMKMAREVLLTSVVKN